MIKFKFVYYVEKKQTQEINIMFFIDFQGPNMNVYSQKHTNCHCGWWLKLRMQLNSANEGMTCHQERKKRPRKKTLLEKIKMAAKN